MSLRVHLRGSEVDDEVVLVEGQVEDLVRAHLAKQRRRPGLHDL